MRFKKNVNLWDRDIVAAIKSGNIKLQCGQWVQCGAGMKSRYISHNEYTFNVVHWQGTGEATNLKFKTRTLYERLNKLIKLSNISFSLQCFYRNACRAELVQAYLSAQLRLKNKVGNAATCRSELELIMCLLKLQKLN